ncbi:MAG: hypothetical protein HPY61_04430 [Methanotrichaceae archaeon]|nr:hypothetical protein [Methanotrichaceae archaeon]
MKVEIRSADNCISGGAGCPPKCRVLNYYLEKSAQKDYCHRKRPSQAVI